MALKAGVAAKIPVADDVEVHVRVAKVEGETLVEARDFIRSKKEYGRGLIVPPDKDALAALGAAFTNLSKGA